MLQEKQNKSEHLLNILNSKYNELKCDLFDNRKQTAEIFLKPNEKENIATKTRSIKWNFDFVKDALDLRSVAANSLDHKSCIVGEQNDRIKRIKNTSSKKDLRFLMLSNELWSKKYYQKVMEDSFLFPKMELFKAKEISKTYKVHKSFVRD